MSSIIPRPPKRRDRTSRMKDESGPMSKVGLARTEQQEVFQEQQRQRQPNLKLVPGRSPNSSTMVSPGTNSIGGTSASAAGSSGPVVVTAAAFQHSISRQNLILDEDIRRILECFEAVDEHNTQQLTYNEFSEFLRLLHLTDHPGRSFLRCEPALPSTDNEFGSSGGFEEANRSSAVSPSRAQNSNKIIISSMAAVAQAKAEGKVVTLDNILYFLFPSYSKEDIAIEAMKHLPPSPPLPAEPPMTVYVKNLYKTCGGTLEEDWKLMGEVSRARITARQRKLIRDGLLPTSVAGDYEGGVSFQTVLKELGEFEIPVETLRASFVDACPQMQTLREKDLADFKTMRVTDMLHRIHLDHVLVTQVSTTGTPCPVETKPPLSFKNLEKHWEPISRQLQPLLTLEQLCRLSDAVLMLKSHGPMAVLRMPWSKELSSNSGNTAGGGAAVDPFTSFVNSRGSSAAHYDVYWESERDLFGRKRRPIDPRRALLPLKNFARLLWRDEGRFAKQDRHIEIESGIRPKAFGYDYDYRSPAEPVLFESRRINQENADDRQQEEVLIRSRQEGSSGELSKNSSPTRDRTELGSYILLSREKKKLALEEQRLEKDRLETEASVDEEYLDQERQRIFEHLSPEKHHFHNMDETAASLDVASERPASLSKRDFADDASRAGTTTRRKEVVSTASTRGAEATKPTDLVGMTRQQPKAERSGNVFPVTDDGWSDTGSQVPKKHDQTRRVLATKELSENIVSDHQEHFKEGAGMKVLSKVLTYTDYLKMEKKLQYYAVVSSTKQQALVLPNFSNPAAPYKAKEKRIHVKKFSSLPVDVFGERPEGAELLSHSSPRRREILAEYSSPRKQKNTSPQKAAPLRGEEYSRTTTPEVNPKESGAPSPRQSQPSSSSLPGRSAGNKKMPGKRPTSARMSSRPSTIAAENPRGGSLSSRTWTVLNK